MVYLAQLLVVMTDGLKTVRIRARNVLRVHEHERLDDYACIASLAPGERRYRVLDASGLRPAETQKNSSLDNQRIWQ